MSGWRNTVIAALTVAGALTPSLSVAQLQPSTTFVGTLAANRGSKAEQPSVFRLKVDGRADDIMLSQCGSIAPSALAKLLGDAVTLTGSFLGPASAKPGFCATDIALQPPGLGDLGAGGQRGMQNSVVFRRRANGTIQAAVQADSTTVRTADAVDSIVDAKVVDAGAVVHNDNSWTVWNGGQPARLSRTDDIIQLSRTGAVLRDGHAISISGAAYDYSPFSEIRSLSANGEYMVWGPDSKIACIYNEMRPDRNSRHIWAPLDHVKMVAANDKQGAALLMDGTVVVWDRLTQAGLQLPRPTAPLRDIAAISAGDDYFLALTTSGTLIAWGNPVKGPFGLSGVVGVVASLGGGAVAAVLRNGDIMTWDPHSGG